jgi:hypothetical protein
MVFQNEKPKNLPTLSTEIIGVNMGVDNIKTSGTFKITRENVENFLIKHYPNDDFSIKEVFQTIGWGVKSSRKDGVTEVYRQREGWVALKEFEFFSKIAHYVEVGSFIIFETIYDGASYEKWEFENTLKYYIGKVDVKWTQEVPDYR